MNVATGPELTKVEKKDGEKPEFILLKSGVMVLGSELIGAKLTAILAESINQIKQNGLACVILRNDDYPQDSDGAVFGAAYADTYSVAINLNHCWNSAIETAKSGEQNLSLLGILWVNLLSAIGHEFDHIDIATKDRDLYEAMRSTKQGNIDLETTADDEARQMIIKLAKTFDIEIPSAGDFGMFGILLMDLFTNAGTRNLEWVVKARTQMEKGLIYEEPENNIFIYTFREFVKEAHDPNGKDWEQSTTCVNLEVHLDNGVAEVFKAEPVIEPEAETLELEPEVEAVEAPAEAVMAAGAFIGAGTVVGDDGPDILIADSDDSEAVQAALAMEPAAAIEVAVAPVALPTPVAAQAATIASAAATGVPPAAAPTTTYTPHNLSNEVMAACMKAVWQSLYAHIFSKCGWQQNPTTGRFFFSSAAAVLEGVNVQHIITQLGADNFIMEYDTVAAEGQYAPEMFQGMIRGRTTSNVGLPSYALYLNIGGQRIKRTFLPQNPEKITNNAYTKSADEAAGGHMIAWVFKDEVADTAPFKEKCAVTIKDNIYQVMS